jgi:hypothetical protein
MKAKDERVCVWNNALVTHFNQSSWNMSGERSKKQFSTRNRIIGNEVRPEPTTSGIHVVSFAALYM